MQYQSSYSHIIHQYTFISIHAMNPKNHGQYSTHSISFSIQLHQVQQQHTKSASLIYKLYINTDCTQVIQHVGSTIHHKGHSRTLCQKQSSHHTTSAVRIIITCMEVQKAGINHVYNIEKIRKQTIKSKYDTVQCIIKACTGSKNIIRQQSAQYAKIQNSAAEQRWHSSRSRQQARQCIGDNSAGKRTSRGNEGRSVHGLDMWHRTGCRIRYVRRVREPAWSIT